MLDNEQNTDATIDPSLPKPPAGRRSRRRPAGPPEPVAEIPPAEERPALPVADQLPVLPAAEQHAEPEPAPSVEVQAEEAALPLVEQVAEEEVAPEEVAPEEVAPEGEAPEDLTAESDELAAIEAAAEHADAAAAEQPDDEADRERDDQADTEQGEGATRRRRRRRGGRRRHSSADADEAEAEADVDADEEDATEGAEAAEGESSEALEQDQDDDQDQDGAESSTSGAARRRRRRRRRRGEDASTGAEDDPTDVVVKVREAHASEDKISAVEGSTRLEAKRQRRREGRAAGRRRAPIVSESEFLARRESVRRQMVLRQGLDFSQIAVLEDGILVEHYVDRESSSSLIGNIYLGKVQNVLPSMEAAFIDIGRGRNAVLYAGEVDWDAYGAAHSDRRIENVLKSGQQVLVQVTKDPVGAKGARLTNHVSIPGRYVVYAPGGHLSGISRKLPDVERKRLKQILAELIEEGASVIVRTAAEGATQEQLVHDVSRLKAQWEGIEKKSKQGGAPQLLYSEPDLTIRTVRDLFTEDFGELIIDGHGDEGDAYESLTEYLAHVAPHLSERVVHWDRQASGDVFSHYRLDEQIAKALERKVHLPSGGSLIIDRTEAMTVIDVNTGKFTGHGGNLEATVTANNLEAAEEIVRQLRLRDIGGIIVIDFIDMVLPGNRELLLRRLVECLGRDRTRHQVSEVTSLGLVQMTRKKIGTGLVEAFTEPCEHCNHRGYIVHEMPVATQAPSDGGDRQGRNNRKRGRGRNGTQPAAQSSASSVNGPQPVETDQEQVSEETRAAAQAAISAVAHAGHRPPSADAADMLDEVVAALQGSSSVKTAEESPVEEQPVRAKRSSRSRTRRTTPAAEPVLSEQTSPAEDVEPSESESGVPAEETVPRRPARKRASRSGTRGTAVRHPLADETASAVEADGGTPPEEASQPVGVATEDLEVALAARQGESTEHHLSAGDAVVPELESVVPDAAPEDIAVADEDPEADVEEIPEAEFGETVEPEATAEASPEPQVELGQTAEPPATVDAAGSSEPEVELGETVEAEATVEAAPEPEAEEPTEPETEESTESEGASDEGEDRPV